MSYWKDFVGTEKRVRIIQGEPAIRVWATEVILYTVILIRNALKKQEKINLASPYLQLCILKFFFLKSSWLTRPSVTKTKNKKCFINNVIKSIQLLAKLSREQMIILLPLSHKKKKKKTLKKKNPSKQEDHDGPILLTWANRFAYLLLKFQPSSLRFMYKF